MKRAGKSSDLSLAELIKNQKDSKVWRISDPLAKNLYPVVEIGSAMDQRTEHLDFPYGRLRRALP